MHICAENTTSQTEKGSVANCIFQFAENSITLYRCRCTKKYKEYENVCSMGAPEMHCKAM